MAEKKTVDVQGSLLNVVDVGSGVPVVLGGSYLWDAEMWAPQVKALSSQYRVIVPELWGHGQSGAMPADTSSVRDVARQHLQLLDALGVERCAIVGLSMGGMWGAELALMAPDRVSALVLMGTSLAAEPANTRVSYFAMLDAIEQYGAVPEPVIVAAVPLFFSATVGSRHPELLGLLAARLRAWDPARLVDSVVPLGRMIFGRRNALDELSALAMPALIATGADDSARSPAEGHAMAERIGCEFVEIPQAGHIASLEAPETVNRILSDFLAQHAASPSRTEG